MTQTNPLKVIQINSMNGWAGGEVHVFLLCRELMSLDSSVTLVCRSGSAIDQRSRSAGIPVINLPLKGPFDLKSAWLLARFCKKNAVDIVHAHLGRDYWTALLAKRFYPEMTVIMTRHIRVPFKNNALHRWLYKKAAKVIAVSQAVKDRIEIFPPENIAVIYNGIDLKRFSSVQPGTLRKELGVSDKTKIVGMVGRVNPSKGHETFLRCIPEVLAQNPDTVFIVVGSGDYIEVLKNINNDVLFLGARDNIPEIMKDLDVFVMASLNEPFGLVTVEAMAAGVPVVAASSGGSTEIIINGESGLLFPPGDPSELAQAIIRVINDAELADRLKDGGLNRAKKFNIKDMAINTLAIYHEARKNN